MPDQIHYYEVDTPGLRETIPAFRFAIECGCLVFYGPYGATYAYGPGCWLTVSRVERNPKP